MPELPEVESVRLGLKSTIDSKILSIDLKREDIVDKESEDLVNLCGQTINEIERKGKYLRILTEKYQFIFHLGMSGVWLLNPLEIRKHTHLIIRTEAGELQYSDPRRFGWMSLIPRFEEGERLKRWSQLGVDAITPNLRAERVFQKLFTSYREIKVALLDQKIIAGLGNIYVCEVLFTSNVDPFLKCCELNVENWKNILKNTRKILKKSIQNRGTTFSDYRLTNGKGGGFQSFLKVFGKEGQSCPKCGSVIQKQTQAGRSTFYCASCQNMG